VLPARADDQELLLFPGKPNGSVWHSPRRALLCHRPKTRSSALFSLDCPLFDQQRVHPSVLPACADDQELLLFPGKLNGSVWHSGLSDFPILGLPCPAGGQRVRNGHLLRKSLQSQNLQ
jgi:hypothetical protein